MSPAGIASFVVFALVAAGVILFVGRYLNDRRSEAWIRAKYGSSVSLMSMCRLLVGARRYRGVVGLAGDRVVWRAVRFNRARIGELDLDSIELVMWEQAYPRRFGAADDPRRERLLTIHDRDGSEQRFVLAAGQALLWDKILEVRLGESRDTASTGEQRSSSDET